MKSISSKNKIFISLGAWLLTCLFLFMIGFRYLENSNTRAFEFNGALLKEERQLNLEKESYEKAKKDLTELEKRPIQPENFFSRDTTLVNEIKYLEDLGKNLNLDLQLSGISGTIGNAAKSVSHGGLLSVPYSITAKGSFAQLAKLAENLENMPFLTTINGMTIYAAELGNVNMTISSNFYLKK